MEYIDYFETKNVLYVEDDENIAREICEILNLLFSKVDYATNGRDGLELYYANKPDLLILDIRMPVIDGLDMLKEIRQNDYNTPAIMITAHDDRNSLKRAVELNIFRYLSKPFARNEFLDALKEVAKFLISQMGGSEINLGLDTSYNSIKKCIISNQKCEILSKKEFILFEYFLKNKDKILTFDELILEVYGYESGSKDSLKTLIKELRKKIAPLEIENVFAVGYKFQTKS
ncbi:response regulator transcription factor [Campylobacter sputorum]|uniref:response regulator transcription factor n=1 Tax=Campylobacter sputorum TaxID=206 RepID=UPI001E3FCE36|nr:response regulator transcription factor [Campylobacter sputorum]